MNNQEIINQIAALLSEDEMELFILEAKELVAETPLKFESNNDGKNENGVYTFSLRLVSDVDTILNDAIRDLCTTERWRNQLACLLDSHETGIEERTDKIKSE